MEGKERKMTLDGLKGRRLAIIYLTDWQMRMVKDFLGLDCHTWILTADAEAVLRYGVFPNRDRVKHMYLTDWQRREIKDELGFTCEFIELKQEIVPMYMIKGDEARDLIKEQPPKACFRLVLDDEQKASIKDLFGIACEIIDIPVDKSDLVKYRVVEDRGEVDSSLREFVLNRTQQKALYDQFGAKCDSLLIDQSVIYMYGVSR